MFAFFLAQLYPLLGDGNIGLFEQDKDQVLVLNGTNLGEFVVDWFWWTTSMFAIFQLKVVWIMIL